MGYLFAGCRSRQAALGIGLGAILAVFLLPVFLLKLGLLIGGASSVAYVLLPLVFGPVAARRFSAAFIVFNIALVISLIFAEFGVRLAFSGVTTTGDNSSYFARRWARSLPPPNTLGFREREIARTPPNGVYRIAVIGDSFTWGQGIEASDRMTERLENLLNRSDNLTFEVLNFGRPGAQTVDHIETLRNIVLPLQPDFVLMQWYINDVRGHDMSPYPKGFRLLPSESASSWLQRRSALYYLINQQWVSLQVELELLPSYVRFMDRSYADPESPESIAAQAALEDFISITRDAEVGVGIVAFPDLILADSVEDFPLSYLIDRVMAVCAKEKIRCVDLRKTYLGISDPEGLWANELDRHPGPVANDLAAEAVAAQFADNWTAENSAAGRSR